MVSNKELGFIARRDRKVDFLGNNGIATYEHLMSENGARVKFVRDILVSAI
jgi:hypothetical protein